MARVGGDEFVIIASGTEQDGRERIRAFEQLLAGKNAEWPNRPFDITASIGHVCFPVTELNTLDERVKEADRLMYEYKAAHKKQRGN